MRKWLSMTLALLLCLMISGCGSAIPNTVRSGSDLYGKRIAVLRGSSIESFSLQKYFEQYTQAGTTFQIYETAQECAAAVENGSCDCMITDRQIAVQYTGSGKKLKILDDIFMLEDYSMVTARENIRLQEALNSAITFLKQEGTLDKIIEKYLQGAEYTYEPSLSEEDASGTLTVAVDRNFAPFSFTDSGTGKRLGLDLEVARAICDVLQVNLNIVWMERSDIAGGIMDGSVDFTLDRWSKNEKDQELVAFTDAYFTSDQVIVVRK